MAKEQSTLVVRTETPLSDREQLLNIYRFVDDLINKRNFELLNTFLDQQDVEHCSPVITSGLLRISSRAKAVLPSWNMLLRDVVCHFKRTNVPNWQGLMVGLTDEQGNIS